MASLPTSDQPGPGAAVVGAQRGWWLEDARPGARIRHPGGRTITSGEHVWLAWVTHNLSDVHGNADAASRSEWGEPLVLGVLTVAIVMGLSAPATGPAETAASGLSPRWDSIRLHHPVLAGDTIRAESHIESVSESHPGGAMGGHVSRTITGFNQRAEVVVTVVEASWVPRRPQRLSAPS